MSELNVYHHELRPNEYAEFYLKYEADEVISTIRSERDEYRYNLSCARNEIHNLSMSMREDVKRIADKDKVIADLEESHKMEVEQLLMEIAELIEKHKTEKAELEEELVASKRNEKESRELADPYTLYCETSAESLRKALVEYRWRRPCDDLPSAPKEEK